MLTKLENLKDKSNFNKTNRVLKRIIDKGDKIKLKDIKELTDNCEDWESILFGKDSGTDNNNELSI